MKINNICFWMVLFFLSACTSRFDSPESDKKIAYDTLGGVQVTKDNIYSLIQKPPVWLEKKVKNWFAKRPGAYTFLVKQDGYLSDVGNLALLGNQFLQRYNIANLGSLNYVFKFPGENIIVKICGPNNRFFYSVRNYGIDGTNLYVRLIEKTVDGKKMNCYEYMDFDEDKAKMDCCFTLCCPLNFLSQIACKEHIKEIMHIVSCSFPQAMVRGLIYDYLHEEYAKDSARLKDRTIYEIFTNMLDYSFKIVSDRCYKKLDLVDKKFVASYNTANRIFYRNRFAQAIDLFRLDRLEKPPKSYLLNVNPKNPTSCTDEDVILLQEILHNHKPFECYLGRKDLLDKVFDKEAMRQLLIAMKYAGLWDITGKNIHVNINNQKITYIDFEPKNDLEADHWFNKSKDGLRFNLCYLMLEFVKRFLVGTVQRDAVDDFIKENKYIDLNWYRKQQSLKHKISTFYRPGRPMKLNLFGNLLRFENPKSEKLAPIRQAVYKRLASCG